MHILASIILTAATPGEAEGWSAPGVVLADHKPCVTYRARIQGSRLVVSAEHADGWHTYAMDNDLRAKESLAGKPSLGVEQPTTIRVDGVSSDGWLQTKPTDMSRPELRWYRWGFSGTALFAAKLPKANDEQAIRVKVGGQACDEARCILVRVELLVSADARRVDLDLPTAGLVPVRR